MPPKTEHLPPRGHVPQLHTLVTTSRRQSLAIRRKRQWSDQTRVPLKSEHFSSRYYIPQTHGPVKKFSPDGNFAGREVVGFGKP